MLNKNEKIILPNMKYKINVVTKEMTRLSGKSISRKIKVGKYRVKIDLPTFIFLLTGLPDNLVISLVLIFILYFIFGSIIFSSTCNI
jgi:uncharacterized membrane protein